MCASLHSHVENFSAGIKSLLDLLMPLLNAEKIVNCTLHGFNKGKGKGQDIQPGGRILNALSANVAAGNLVVAESLRLLIMEHKERWIDTVIALRDTMTHPPEGWTQLMFRLKMSVESSEVHCEQILVPDINGIEVDAFAEKSLKLIKEFCQEYLRTLASARK